MPRSRTRFPVVAAWLGCWAAGIVAMASPAALADAVPNGLRATPAKAELVGPDAVQQLAIDAEGPGMASRDLTDTATYVTSDSTVATVDAAGTITARGDGSATITITIAGGPLKAQVPVSVRAFVQGPPINFANQVVPIFTKLGCNSGGCHGKASGQNGFRLSLLGFEPDLDFETLVKEGRGRRLFPAAPEQSLLLRKATAKVPHGGGRKMEPSSHEYRVVARWIASGMPKGRPDDPTVAKIEIFPPGRIMPRGGTQQLVVTATYTDGSTEDVTRWAQYQSNEPEVAGIAEGGRVETHDLAGQAALMARYQGQVAVFRATVPLGLPIATEPDFPPANFVDVLAAKQWKSLGIVPSGTCTDGEFIRRASLDVIATLPSPAETRAFLADPDPEKRAKLVDRLLSRPEYASSFATKWADILRNKREGNAQFQHGTYRFHDWIRKSLAENLPYDRFARAILAASGTPEATPAVNWYRRLRTADAFVDDSAQVFLGMRLQCAKCHHHPFEKWGQDDYYGFAAFFAKVGRKPSSVAQRTGRTEEVIFHARTGSVTNPKTGQVMAPKGLGVDAVPIEAGADPREKLVDWMADPKNPYFARALANRYWAHFMGRGLCEPMDDLRQTNPPANPDLLDALAAEFIQSGYDLKHLIRIIASSRVYGLSSIPNEYNARDKQNFARHYPRRIGAEPLLDAIAQVTGVPTEFAGLPKGTRAIDLPDESVASSFLDTFGRPKRDTACECERVGEASLGQSLMLLNSQDVQSKLAAATGRAGALALDKGPDEPKIEDLFWSAFGRPPSSTETASALTHLKAHAEKRREAFEDILWALVNAKEFQFND